MTAASPTPVYQVVYHSLATSPQPDSAANSELLRQARAYNEAHEISGILLYAESTGEYLQVLEGEREVVQKLYENIRRDPRHERVFTLGESQIAERNFADWRMGFAPLEADELDHIVGYINPRAVPLPGSPLPLATPLLDLLANFARTRDVAY